VSPEHQQAPIAVVGAGVAGLACAGALERAGLTVRVFEKSRGVGGRAATRRVGGASFDLGAPYLSSVQRDFADWLAGAGIAGVVRTWSARVAVVSGESGGDAASGAGLVVGVTGMSSVARSLAQGCDVRHGVRVSGIGRVGGRWLVRSDDGRELGLSACGDWCGGSRVERAFTSGSAVAAAIVADEEPARSSGS